MASMKTFQKWLLLVVAIMLCVVVSFYIPLSLTPMIMTQNVIHINGINGINDSSHSNHSNISNDSNDTKDARAAPTTGAPTTATATVDGFTGAWDSTLWSTPAQSPGASFTHGSTQLYVVVGGSGGGVTRSITVPVDGTISFDWTATWTGSSGWMTVKYQVNDVHTEIATGTGSGSVTGIVVAAGDVFSFYTCGGTQYSQLNAVFNTFVVVSPSTACSLGGSVAAEVGGQTFIMQCQFSMAIVVTSATYGGNCGVVDDNALSRLQAACDGFDTCSYTIYADLWDPAPGCSKEYDYCYMCVTGEPTTASPTTASPTTANVTKELADIISYLNNDANNPTNIIAENSTKIVFFCPDYPPRGGNDLSRYWVARAFAFFLNIPFDTKECWGKASGNTPNYFGTFLPRSANTVVGTNEFIEWVYRIKTLNNGEAKKWNVNFPHECALSLLFNNHIFIETVIRVELKAAFAKLLEMNTHGNEQFALRTFEVGRFDVVLHIRCGDVFHYPANGEQYGFSQFLYYKKALECMQWKNAIAEGYKSDVDGNITVWTMLNTNSDSNKKDCIALSAELEMRLLHFFANLLGDTFGAKIRIKVLADNGINDDVYLIMKGPFVICSSSTFCWHAALGNIEGHIAVPSTPLFYSFREERRKANDTDGVERRIGLPQNNCVIHSEFSYLCKTDQGKGGQSKIDDLVACIVTEQSS